MLKHNIILIMLIHSEYLGTVYILFDVAIPEYSGNVSGTSEFIIECDLWEE